MVFEMKNIFCEIYDEVKWKLDISMVEILFMEVSDMVSGFVKSNQIWIFDLA